MQRAGSSFRREKGAAMTTWQPAANEIADRQFDLLRANRPRLNEWAREFVLNVDRRRHRMTDKQRAIVGRLVQRIGGHP